MKMIGPIEIRTKEDWHRTMHELQQHRPTPPPERPLADDELGTLEDIINSSRRSLLTVDCVFNDHSLKEVSDGLRKLSKKGKVRLLSSSRGRYCSHSIWDGWDKRRRFQEQVG